MLGQDLVKVFKSDKDYKVVAWDREEIDISNEAQVQRRVTELKPDIIINAAAYNAVDKCEEPEGFEEAKKVNGLAVGYLAKTAKDISAIIVHYSTDYVFDGTKKEGYQEDDEPRPINKYAETKVLGEQELPKNTDKFYLIRTSRLFGLPASSHQRRGSPSGAAGQGKKSFFEIMLKLAKKRERIEGVDNEISCFTYTPDLAQATKDLIEKKLDFGIYHVVNSEPCSWYEALLELLRQAGLRIRVDAVPASKFPRPAKRPKFSILLNTKLPPVRSYKEALREFLDKKTNS